MDPSALRSLGNGAVAVTQLGFGGALLGGFRVTIPEPEAIATVQAAVDAGVNYFDTSPFYGYGRSEHRVGQVLRGLPRDQFVISTKVGRYLQPLDESAPPADHRPGGLPFQAVVDYSAAGAERSLEQSMARLGIPKIDIVYIHDVDVFTHGTAEAADQRYREALEGCYPYLEGLRQAGVVGAIGVGLNETERSLRFARDSDIDCILIAGRYTLLDQSSLTELLPLCLARGIRIVMGSPYNSGILATGANQSAPFNYAAAPDHILRKTERLRVICDRYQVPLAAAALQFPLAHEAVASVIPGAVSAAEVNDNDALMRYPIPGDFWTELVRQGLLPEAVPLPRAVA